MARVKQISAQEANDDVKSMYAELEKKMGRVPNIFQNMGNSAAVLKGFLGLNEAAENTSLPAPLREEIALTVGEANHCCYSLAAHTAIAQQQGVAEADVPLARQAISKDPKTQAILKFAKLVVDQRGSVTDADVNALKAAGVSDQELVEIVLVITENMFANYFNHITDPKIDFPLAPDLV